MALVRPGSLRRAGDGVDAPAWRLELPPARVTTLGELRIAAWLDDPYCPIDSSTRRLFEETIMAIEGAGGRVDTEARPGFTLEKADTVFNRLLYAALSGEHKPDKIEHLAANTDDTPRTETAPLLKRASKLCSLTNNGERR